VVDEGSENREEGVIFMNYQKRCLRKKGRGEGTKSGCKTFNCFAEQVVMRSII